MNLRPNRRRASALLLTWLAVGIFALPTLAEQPVIPGANPDAAQEGPQNLTVKRFMVFVPSKDLALSRRFYLAMGADLVDDGADYSEFKWAEDRFILRPDYPSDWAENFGVHVIVEDAEAFARRARELVARGEFPGVRVTGPRDEPWQYRVTYVRDPSGVELRFSQSLKSEAAVDPVRETPAPAE